MIEVDGIRKRFGEVEAVNGVSFAARDGQVTALLGPNGAGKTTTLRTIYGLVRPDAGRVSVDGVHVTRDPLAARALCGVLPESRGTYARLTAREHIRYFTRLRGSDVDVRCTELAELLGMHAIMDRRAAGFSQGERTKVALGRALAHGPQHVLLDEPTLGLDVMSARAIRGAIRQLRDAGKCVVFSSHIMREVAELSDSIVIVAGGVVTASGTPDKLH